MKKHAQYREGVSTTAVVLLVVIIGLIIWDIRVHTAIKEGVNTQNTTHTETASGSDTSDFVLSASMSCADGTHFVVEFPTADTVQIVVNGNIVKTLPRSMGAVSIYEDLLFAYTFAGEEVVVTNKSNNKKTTCTQPFDPNNAPVNFGDAGEGVGADIGSIQQDISLIIGESIAGKWQSTEDKKFTREFKSNGSVIDYYDSKVVTRGTWKVFTKANPEQVAFPLEMGAVYVQLSVSGIQADKLNFKLSKITPEELELIYMERGGRLRFMKV